MLTILSYLAYLAAEFPMNYLMQRFRIDRVLAICCALWGICVFGVAASNNFTQRESTEYVSLTIHSHGLSRPPGRH